ncbi:hypothetical protein [Ornithinimicrobium cryptoxanthini]|uniref:hypothetical protein n=1 Tax=Ornithinimicrobium cryptoxanthini TaxID=2934161 RepID=UPI0021199B8C|nr:hypothetical protein [Ornithinimicrobium cryptoxanthini]
MRRTMTIALTATALLGLSACGGSEPLTQEQSREALLTQEDFPLDGFAAGTVEEGASDSEATDALADFPGADQFSDECTDALESVENVGSKFTTQSSVDFTGDDSSATLIGPAEVTVVVASLEEGDNPLEAVNALSSACDEVKIEEQGMELTINFNEVDGDAQGAKISLSMGGQAMEMVIAGREDGGNYAVVTGTGVSDEELMEVLDAQEEKIADL